MRRRHFLLRFSPCILALSAATAAASSLAHNLTERAEVQRFIAEVAAKHRFEKSELTRLFEQVEIRPEILEAISRPAEAKPWYEYRPIFLTRDRIQEGRQFILDHLDILQKAESRFGVPKEIIAAIIGVETKYGRYKGRYRVIDSLTTLGFEYPRRARFFRRELVEFLLLTREEQVDPLTLRGSYAGAMGQPQFISSSFRRWAVDFDGDNKRDIWTSTADTIGSVANYFKEHGWRPGEMVTLKARPTATAATLKFDDDLKPNYTLSHLKTRGLRFTGDGLSPDHKAAVITLETRNGPEYWLGFHNFYVISRYNHSAMYAMAVYQLSQELKSATQAVATP